MQISCVLALVIACAAVAAADGSYLFEFADDSGDTYNYTLQNSNCATLYSTLASSPYSCSNSSDCGCTNLFMGSGSDNSITISFKVCFDSGWCDCNVAVDGTQTHIPGQLINNLYTTTESSAIDAATAFVDYVCAEFNAVSSKKLIEIV